MSLTTVYKIKISRLTNQALSKATGLHSNFYDTFCEAVDNGKEVRVVFLDITKAFDRVWH